MKNWPGYLLTRAVVALFSLVPFPVLYVISDGVAFLLHSVIRYRRGVVADNLARCFPEKSSSERDAIARASYRNLSDIILESLKGASVSIENLKKRFTYENYEIVNQLLREGKSIMLAGGHYNNWEWGCLTIAGGFEGKTIGVYKPLSNPLTNQWFFKNRSRDGFMILKSMKETFPAVLEYQGVPTVFILVADQMPSNRKTAVSAQFFGQKTACLPGPEKISADHNYPFFLYHIRRVKRGHYQLSFRPVCMNPADTRPGELTQLYMNAVEAEIREQPENWLWSHKRWKWS